MLAVRHPGSQVFATLLEGHALLNEFAAGDVISMHRIPLPTGQSAW
jgi:hypothetical protein